MISIIGNLSTKNRINRKLKKNYKIKKLQEKKIEQRAQLKKTEMLNQNKLNVKCTYALGITRNI